MELTLNQALKKGVEAQKSGEVQEADLLYTAILKVQPNHPDANHNMGALTVGLGKLQESLPFFKKALEANPAIIQFWLSYIVTLIELGRLADAKALLDQANQKGIKSDSFERLKQKLTVTGGNADGSCSEETNYIVQNPSNTQVPSQEKFKALIDLYNKGQLQHCLDVGLQLLQKFPSSIALYNIQGASNAGLQKFDEAVESYKQVLKIEPGYANAHYNIGIVLHEQGKPEKAIESYRKALAIQPDYVDAYNNMGNALKDKGNLEEAIEAYSNAITIKPDYAEAYSNMGTALKAQGKLEEAKQCYKKAINIKPDYAEAHNNIGNALKDQGQLEDVKEAYRKAIDIKPDYTEAYNNMGVVLHDQGKVEEAIEFYNKALSIKPDYAEAKMNLAILLYETGELEKAAELFATNDTIKSQSFLLKCFYEQDKKLKFYHQLDFLLERGENNASIGSLISRSEIRYGVNRPNPFCNYPFEYVTNIDLTTICDFQDIFVKGASAILRDETVQHKSQGHLTNGIQTSGNVFALEDFSTDKIQDILRTELEKYRSNFNDSNEGLIRDWPSVYDIKGWLVSMKSGGELSAHIHENGWITGSVYINVPPKTKIDSGNLVLSIDDNENEKSKINNIRSLDVVTGSLCLFPASLLHYTIPFESDEDRIVLAFDVIPQY